MRKWLLFTFLIAINWLHGEKTPLGPYAQYLLTGADTLTPQQALDLFAQGQGTVPTSKLLNFGFVQTKQVWVLFSLPMDTSGGVGVLEIQNPHLEEVRLYEVFQGEPLFRGISGDWVAVNDRTWPHFNPVFFLERHGEAKFLLRLDKDGSNIRIPLYYWEYDEFKYHDNLHFALIGGLLGIMALCALVGFLLFAVLGKSLFGWYTLYVLINLIYLSVNLGFAQLFLYPELPRLNDYVRVYSLVLAMLAFVWFSLHYLNLKKHYPRTNQLIRLGFWMLVFPLVISLILPSWTKSHFNYIFPVILIDFAFINVLLLGSAYALMRKRHLNGILYAIGYSLVMAFSMLIIGREMNWINDSFWVSNGLWFAYLIEVTILLLGMAYDLNLVFRERLALGRRLLDQEKQMVNEFFNGQEQERQRMAEQLHDGIAGNLAALGFLISNNSEESKSKASKLVKSTLQEVRNLSHELFPPDWKETGWLQTVQKAIQQASGSELEIEMDVRGSDWDQLKGERGLLAYRILQEALNNVRKHANANKLKVAIRKTPNAIEVVVADNGVGFNVGDEHVGIGVRSIKNRIERIHGASVRWNSVEGKGTRFELRIPY